MASGDWIKVHRKLLEHPIMRHDGLCRLWTYCLLRANWKPVRWLMPGTTVAIDIPRGAFVTGRHTLHETLYPRHKASDPSESTLWRWLLSLEEMQCISLRNLNNRCTLVTVCNYETYQSSASEEWTADGQPVNNCRTTDEQLMNTEEEIQEHKEDKEGKNSSCVETAKPSSSPKPAVISEPPVLSFPCDGKPSAWGLVESQLAQWRELYPSLDVDAECRSALAWVLADATRRKTARGMPKFLVGWLSRSQNRGRANGNSKQRTLVIGAGQTYDPSAANYDPNFGRM